MIKKVPLTELKNRMYNFRKQMDISNPEWEIAVIFSKINLYYFTGTMQDGMLIIPRHGKQPYGHAAVMKEPWTNLFFPA